MSYQLSVFIPTIYSGYDQDHIKAIFAKNVGRVSRVEFTKARNQYREGRTNYVRTTYVRSAYVHFAFFYNNRLSKLITEKAIHSNSGLKYIVSSHEYWMLMQDFNACPQGKTIDRLTKANQHAQNLVSGYLDEIRSLYNRLDENRKSMKELQQKYNNLQLDYVELQDELGRTREVASDLMFAKEHLNMSEVYENYNYMAFGKRCNARWLLNNEDNGTVSNEQKHVAVVDETSTIVSELDLNSGDEDVINDSDDEFISEDEDDEDDSELREYIREHVRPELFGRTVEEEMKNYKKH
jgi:hypothetical protein